MKIILMSGAVANAGDFLITKRSIELLKHCIKDSDIEVINRLNSCDSIVDKLNSADVLVWGGGPLFQPNIYPKSIPFVTNLEKVTVPQFSIGLGWKGQNLQDEQVYSYKLSGETLKFVDKMIGSNFNIGCRDFFTIRMLKNNGINKCSMVGCPAWYDLNSVNKLNVNKKIGEVKKICISDPWRYSSYYQVVELVELLRNRFSKSKIYLIYHRGNTLNECGTECFNEIQILEEKLKRYNVESVNISGSAEKLDIYDDCDLHIGWRVHAHIYNMSIRNISILIEEDARGGGFNEIVGMQSIKAYKNNLNDKNSYLNKAIDDCIDRLIKTDYFEIEKAFFILNKYYGMMEKHICSLKNRF
ncbi:MAG: polysaccharide pyruvyl transferase family protein [Lachnospiraceae bacterium]|nr:polysaccharide pyruvyl transferase family protein [Lachnospiraceae bacterium]